MNKKTWFFTLALLAIFTLLGWLVTQRLLETGTETKKGEGKKNPIAVEVAPILEGHIERLRDFSGTLQALSEIVVAPKVTGRIRQLHVDLSDPVSRDQVVAELDNDEYVQTVRQAQADLAVAQANLAEARSLLRIAERELQRVDKLRERGVSSESQRDLAKADQLAKGAHVEVTQAQVIRAQSALETARIRLGYTQVAASWRGGSEQRLVAERHVDEGDTITANAPLLRIVELDPIKAVIFVTERDYALLRPGQPALLTTDAHPGAVFKGTISRISPVFRETTRQAQVELQVKNPDLKLKPGMFVRASVVLEQVESAKIIPEQALATRDDQSGLFVVSADGKTVNWRPVTVGIRQGRRLQVMGESLTGRVVTLGQQLLDDGSAIRIAEEEAGNKP
jgi:RND family efflux transporter MFP subunit